MNRRDFESLNVFDGDKFLVWKYHMEICLEEKDIMLIVSGTIPKPPDGALEHWQKANTPGRCMISSSVTLPVLENLVNFLDCNRHVGYSVCILSTKFQGEYLHGLEQYKRFYQCTC